MHRRKILPRVIREGSLFVLAGLLIFFPVSMVGGADVLKCDLKACIGYALKNRNDARAAKFDGDAADLGITIARSKFSPKINVDTEAGYFTGNPTTPFAIVGDISEEGIPRQDRSDPYYSARFNLDIPLFVEGTIYRKNAPSVKKREYERSHKIALRESIESHIMNEVSEAYFDLLQMMREVEINELNAKLKKLNHETIDAKFLEGLVPETDLITARIDLLNVKKDLDISMNELNLRKIVFIKSLGGPLNLKIEMSYSSLDIAELPDVNILIDKAFSRRSDIKSTKALFEMEREDAEFYTMSNYPSVNLIAGYTLADDFDPPLNDSWNIFMKVSLPILDGGFNKNNASLSEIKAKMINENLAWLYQEIKEEVWHSYYDVKGLQIEFEMRGREIKLMEEKLSVTREKVKENLLPEVALKEEEIKLEIEKKRNLQLEYRVSEAIARLNKVIGDAEYALP